MAVRDAAGAMIVPPPGLGFFDPSSGSWRWLAPLTDVRWLAPDSAEGVREDDPSLTVLLAEASYVVPWWLLKSHHVANVALEGRPVTITLCRMSSSAAAFDGRIGDDVRTFQVVGAWKGTLVMADHETESIWTAFAGECIWGVHRGQRLRRLPLLQASWHDCRTLLGPALVADARRRTRDTRLRAPLPGSCEPPLGNFKLVDPRLPQNELVLGVEAGGAARAYRLRDLATAGGVLNDSVGSIEIVALGGPSYYTGIAFSRWLGDRVLRFTCDGERLVDEETTSTWDLTGRAVSGPLAGARLAFVDSLVEEWYAWAAHHPETDIAEPADRR